MTGTPPLQARYHRSLRRVLIAPLIVLLLLLAALAAGAQTLTPETKTQILSGIADIVVRRAFVAGVDFDKWPAYLEKHRAEIDKAENAVTFTNEVNRALREFGFSHIHLLTPRAAVARVSTSTVGIGVIVRKVDTGLEITSIAPASPAAGSDLEVGDTIIEVEGRTADSAEALTNQDGLRVELKVKKREGDFRYVSVERKSYSTVRKETLTWVDPDTAVLRVPTFGTGYDTANVEKLMADAAKAKNLILDLRNNGGGAVTRMNHLLSLLLPDGSPIGTSVSRRMATRYAAETQGDPKDALAIAKWAGASMKTSKRAVDPFTGKIAVLINRGSGSASEIVAAALHENVKAPLVGTKSAGAVLVSVFGRLPEGFQLQYPVSDYITALGVRLEGHPLQPDLEVPATRGSVSDSTVQRAAALLEGKQAGQ